MYTNIKTEKVVELQLNNEERIWLKHVMQNPFYGFEPDDESPQDTEMRQKFFEAMGDW